MKTQPNSSRPLKGKLKSVIARVQHLHARDQKYSLLELLNEELLPYNLQTESWSSFVRIVKQNTLPTKVLQEPLRHVRRLSALRDLCNAEHTRFCYMIEDIEFFHVEKIPFKLLKMYFSHAMKAYRVDDHRLEAIKVRTKLREFELTRQDGLKQAFRYVAQCGITVPMKLPKV